MKKFISFLFVITLCTFSLPAMSTSLSDLDDAYNKCANSYGPNDSKYQCTTANQEKITQVLKNNPDLQNQGTEYLHNMADCLLPEQKFKNYMNGLTALLKGGADPKKQYNIKYNMSDSVSGNTLDDVLISAEFDKQRRPAAQERAIYDSQCQQMADLLRKYGAEQTVTIEYPRVYAKGQKPQTSSGTQTVSTCTPEELDRLNAKSGTKLTSGECLINECKNGFREARDDDYHKICEPDPTQNSATTETKPEPKPETRPASETPKTTTPPETPTNTTTIEEQKNAKKSSFPPSAGTLIASGTITDERTGETLPSANIVAIDSNNNKLHIGNSLLGTSADIDGKFTLKNIPQGTKIQVTFTGYTPQILTPSENMTIKLTESGTNLTEVVIRDCGNEALKKLHAKEATVQDGVCQPTVCENDYDRKPNRIYDEFNDKTMYVCVPKQCSETEMAKFLHATAFEFKSGNCIPTACDDKYELVGTECHEKEVEEDQYCTTNELQSLNAKWGIKDKNNNCIPKDCINNYTLVGNTCVRGECTDEEIKALNAKTGKMVNGECIATSCIDGYTLRSDKCYDNESEKKAKEAEQEYKETKERETSYANRMLGGATMAATGIGGMELAQGLAEQKADEAADRDMQAYMATFQCKIGNKGGKTYTGGTKGIETPGANQLINLYQEYVNLAADLKQRKEDLGLRPGVESEVVLDKANMGLYSDEAMIEKRNGTYASIYRAATGNETDAEKLAAERDKSAKRVKTGAIVAGAGVVGGIAGNIMINKGHLDNGLTGIKEFASSKIKTGKVDETSEENAKAEQQTPEQNCTETGGTWTSNKCTCPSDKTLDEKHGSCIDKKRKQKCIDAGGEMGFLGLKCKCKDETKTYQDGKCVDDADKIAEKNCEDSGGDWKSKTKECKCDPEKETLVDGKCVNSTSLLSPQEKCEKLGGGKWENGKCVYEDMKKINTNKNTDDLFNQEYGNADSTPKTLSKKDTKQAGKELSKLADQAAKNELAIMKKECIDAGNMWNNITDKCVEVNKSGKKSNDKTPTPEELNGVKQELAQGLFL